MFYKIHKNKSPFNLLNLYWRKHLYILHLRMLRMLFRWSKLNITFSKTLFYHLQPFVTLKVLTCSIALSSNFIRTTSKKFFNCYNHKRIRLMTRLCIRLGHLCEHKFNYNFENCINPLCSYGMDIE